MKKFIAISLAMTYLLVSSGLLLEIHHCMGRIADTGLTILAAKENDQCGKCGMDKSNSGKHCCKDEYKQVKISLDQKSSSQDYTIVTPYIAEVANVWALIISDPVQLETCMAYKSHAPPIFANNRQSLLCVFKI